MGGSNPNDSITATRFNPNEGIGSGISTASVNRPWDVESAHPELANPEAVTQGMIKGIGSLATSALSAGSGLAAGAGASDATSASQAAGNVGPVASNANPPQGFVDAKRYMRNPSMDNYEDFNDPQKFKFNYNQ